MAKNNPNRQELLQFINQSTSQLNNPAKKIEDLSSGVQYLHLLHQTHPHIVKMQKVNLKASQEYQNVNNLRLLATYLAQINAPFTFQVQKVSQRNYQENLSLLKNLYKFHFTSKQQKKQQKNQEKNKGIVSRKTSMSSSFIDSKNDLKNQAQKKKKNLPVVQIKPIQNMKKTIPGKKYEPENGGFEGVIQESKNHTQQIKKILVVVKNQENNKSNQSAQAKLDRIKKILGLEVPASHSRRKNEQKDDLKINYSTKCEPEKSSSKKHADITSSSNEVKQLETKSEQKKQLSKIDEKPQNAQDSKKQGKQFDCQQIKQSVLRKYEEPYNLRPTSHRKSRQSRMSTRNVHQWLSQEQDTRYNQNLLSPQPDVRQSNRRDISNRKPILRTSQNYQNFSFDKHRNQSLKKVHFNKEENQSGRKKLSGTKNPQLGNVKISSAAKSPQKIQQQSQNKERSNASGQRSSSR